MGSEKVKSNDFFPSIWHIVIMSLNTPNGECQMKGFQNSVKEFDRVYENLVLLQTRLSILVIMSITSTGKTCVIFARIKFV